MAGINTTLSPEEITKRMKALDSQAPYEPEPRLYGRPPTESKTWSSPPEYVDEWILPEEEKNGRKFLQGQITEFYFEACDLIPDEPPPDLCMYARPVLTGIAIPDVRGFLGPKEIQSGHACAQRDSIQEQRREESLQVALKQYKRTHREWPVCKFGGEVHGHIHKVFTGELQLALECDECSAIQEDLDWYEREKA